MVGLGQEFWVVVCVVGLVGCGSVQPLLDGGDDGAGTDAAPLPPLPSCVALLSTCGASGNDSCCNSPEVVGGTYYRGYDIAGDVNSGDKGHPATVSTFRLDKYEVTVGRFRAFVNAGMGTQSNPPISGAGARLKIAGSGWDANWNVSLATNTAALIAAIKCDSTYETWTDTPGANEHRPMNCLTWYEGMAFCAWDGGYLATEAEWNYAATGGEEQRAYPWSSPAGALTVDGAHASYNDGTNCVGDGMVGCAVTDLVEVGTKPMGDGRWGQADLAGNVFEWTLDSSAGYLNPCTDCADLTLTATTGREARGGSFDFAATNLRAGGNNSGVPSERYSNTGIRCARSAL